MSVNITFFRQRRAHGLKGNLAGLGGGGKYLPGDRGPVRTGWVFYRAMLCFFCKKLHGFLTTDRRGSCELVSK